MSDAAPLTAAPPTATTAPPTPAPPLSSVTTRTDQGGTGTPLAPPTGGLTVPEQALFDRLTADHSWRLGVPEDAPFRTRTLTNPTPGEHPAYPMVGLVGAVLLGLGGVTLAGFGAVVLGWAGMIAGVAWLARITVTARRQRSRTHAVGAGPRLVVPETVAAAYLDFAATRAAVEPIEVPAEISLYLDQAAGYLDQLVVTAHRLHRRGLATAQVGAAVSTETVQVAAEAAAVVDVFLGAPVDRGEAVAWREARAALAQHPPVRVEDAAVAAAFTAYRTTLGHE